MGRLDGKRVLLTGASSGIGLAAARQLAEEGADLALIARGRAGLNAAADMARECGSRVVVLPTDVSDAEAVEASVDAAEQELGGLDVVVANAGASAYGRFTETTREDFERVVQVTLFGAVNTIRAALPALERSGGTLVVTGSVASRVPLPLQTAYVAAKHGLRGFVNSLRPELRAAGSRISIAVVDPGPVATPFWDHVATSEAELPPRIAGSYSAETVAEAIVQAAVSPRGQRTVGAAIVPLEMCFRVGRPLMDRVMGAGVNWVLAHGRPRDSSPAAIWEPSGTGHPHSGFSGRRSMLRTVEKLVQR